MMPRMSAIHADTNLLTEVATASLAIVPEQDATRGNLHPIGQSSVYRTILACSPGHKNRTHAKENKNNMKGVRHGERQSKEHTAAAQAVKFHTA